VEVRERMGVRRIGDACVEACWFPNIFVTRYHRRNSIREDKYFIWIRLIQSTTGTNLSYLVVAVINLVQYTYYFQDALPEHFSFHNA